MDLMAPLIAQDPGSPRITTYTAAGRMELSAATADNWAAKVANLLAATGVGRGDAVAVLASTGWMPLVVTLGCWRIGATVTDGSGAGAGEHVGVVVTGSCPRTSPPTSRTPNGSSSSTAVTSSRTPPSPTCSPSTGPSTP
ncbi:TIGR03089 family protein, partial [Corynebacterium bovis]